MIVVDVDDDDDDNNDDDNDDNDAGEKWMVKQSENVVR